MQYIQPDHPDLRDLSLDPVIAYLLRHNWQEVTVGNPKIRIFQKGFDDNGKPIEIVLPHDTHFQDGPRVFAKALNLVGVVEAQSPEEILETVRDHQSLFF